MNVPYPLKWKRFAYFDSNIINFSLEFSISHRGGTKSLPGLVYACTAINQSKSAFCQFLPRTFKASYQAWKKLPYSTIFRQKSCSIPFLDIACLALAGQTPQHTDPSKGRKLIPLKRSLSVSTFFFSANHHHQRTQNILLLFLLLLLLLLLLLCIPRTHLEHTTIHPECSFFHRLMRFF